LGIISDEIEQMKPVKGKGRTALGGKVFPIQGRKEFTRTAGRIT